MQQQLGKQDFYNSQHLSFATKMMSQLDNILNTNLTFSEKKNKFRHFLDKRNYQIQINKSKSKN